MSARSFPELDEVADLLHGACLHLVRSVHSAESQSGLRPAQLSVLELLARQGRQTISALADEHGVRVPSMTRIVQALDEAGHVRRHRALDARVSLVEATAAGIAELRRCRRLRVDLIASRLRALPEDELRTLSEAAAILWRPLN
ncbi:MAG TPA: MarR family winged helix-turn-helix transcriptional regulator [Gaiellaceae bacterium]|nr:MarR family winged helix-turn-helix transcriptional regulator [Gaiellaceae bacterium]